MKKYISNNSTENRLLDFSPRGRGRGRGRNRPQGNPHAQENFSEHVEDTYSMETGEGGFMALYDKHYQGKVDKINTEITTHLENIRKNTPDSADKKTSPLVQKQETWTNYYGELSNWMQSWKNEFFIARALFDEGMSKAEQVINMLDSVAIDAQKMAVKRPTQERKAYSEKMAEYFEKEALSTMTVAGQLSTNASKHIIDIPDHWVVVTDGVLVARPNAFANDKNERPVASGRNRVYINGNVSEFIVKTTEGMKKVVVERGRTEAVYRIEDMPELSERKEIIAEAVEELDIAVDAVLTHEAKEGETQPKMTIEIDVENNEAHENTEEIAAKDPIADNLITEATLDAITPEDVEVTIDKDGNTLKIDLENADINVEKQASAIVDTAVTKSLDIGKDDTTVSIDATEDIINIQTTDRGDAAILNRAMSSLTSADIARVKQENGTFVIEGATEKTDDVVQHLRKMAKTDGSADVIHGDVDLSEEQKIVTEADKKEIDKLISIDNQYRAYDGLQRLIFKTVYYMESHDNIKSPADIGEQIIKRMQSDRSGEIYIKGRHIMESDTRWLGQDERIAENIITLIRTDPVAALESIRSINYSSSHAPTTKKFLDRGNQEFNRYTQEKALTYEELKDSKHVMYLVKHMKQIGERVRDGASTAVVKREIQTANSVLRNFQLLASRAGLGLALEKSMLPARSKDGKTLYRFVYDSKTNKISYIEHNVDEHDVIHP